MYNVVGDKLYRNEKEVLRLDNLRGEVEKIHGIFGFEHKCGLKKLEEKLREKYECIGLRPILLKLCEGKCKVCDMTVGIRIWFSKNINRFEPVNETVGRRVCERLGITYQGVPTVEYRVPFHSPSSLEAISPNGNCVFLALLHGIGGDKEQHEILRTAVFQHMLKEDIAMKLQIIYGDGFTSCLSHRAVECQVNEKVCGIVIHAAASLLGIDVLTHWEGEDGALEWLLALASLQKRVWADNQIGLRFLNNHVDFITKYK